MAVDNKEVSLQTLWDSMQQMHTKMDGVRTDLDSLKTEVNNVRQDVAGIRSRVDTAEQQIKVNTARVSVVEERNDALESRMDDAEAKIDTLRKEYQEKMERIKRAANIMIFGIPESNEGILLATNLIHKILPERSGNYPMERHGDPGIQRSRPRPLRVQLNGAGEKFVALKNCKLLKGLVEFKGISVRPDQTKTQIQTRSQTRNKGKRTITQSQTEEEDSEQTEPAAKIRRTSTSTTPDSAMETNED